MTINNQSFVVAALYKFTRICNPAELRATLLGICKSANVCGTLLVAREGINGTIAAPRAAIEAVRSQITALPGFSHLEWKESAANAPPFKRLKVRMKDEIVTLGVEGVDPTRGVGTYVPPEDWNDLISSPDVIVIDTRNAYEAAIGTFAGAIDPATKSFAEFPAWAESHLTPAPHQKIAMFCTGGIRCEKATAYMKQKGFENVYHLQGGILKYLEQVPPEESLWKGECFVFDERVAIGHGLAPGSHQLCPACRKAIATGEPQGGYAARLCASCQSDAPASTKKAATERLRQIEIAKRRGARHLGPKTPGE